MPAPAGVATGIDTGNARAVRLSRLSIAAGDNGGLPSAINALCTNAAVPAMRRRHRGAGVTRAAIGELPGGWCGFAGVEGLPNKTADRAIVGDEGHRAAARAGQVDLTAEIAVIGKRTGCACGGNGNHIGAVGGSRRRYIGR